MFIRVLAFVEQQLCRLLRRTRFSWTRCFLRVIELDPKDTDAHGWLGSTLQDMLDLKGAAESFGKVIELDPKHVFSRKMLECVLKAIGDLKGAAESFGRALDPKGGFVGSLRRGKDFRAMRAPMSSQVEP